MSSINISRLLASILRELKVVLLCMVNKFTPSALQGKNAYHIKHVATCKSTLAFFILPCCVLHTGYVMLSSGIPWIITRVTCIFSVYRRVSDLAAIP